MESVEHSAQQATDQLDSLEGEARAIGALQEASEAGDFVNGHGERNNEDRIKALTRSESPVRKDVDHNKEDDYLNSSREVELETRKGVSYSSDILKGSDLRSHTASMRQMIDKTFFDSMAIEKIILPLSDDPLHIAISASDPVGVQMLLDELGNSAPSSIAKRDADGRTAVHLAVMSGSDSIVEHIIGAYRFFESLILQTDLVKLEKERDSSIAKLRLGVQGARGTQDVFDNHKQTIDAWFHQERTRRIRQFEFRTEIWWAQMMCTKDLEGRTPLHYAVSSGASRRVIEALITKGRGEFFVEEGCVLPYELAGLSSEETKKMSLAMISMTSVSRESKDGGAAAVKPRKPADKEKGEKSKALVLREQFRDNCMYEITSGGELALWRRPNESATTPAYHSSHFKPDALLLAEPKKYNKTTVRLRNVSWDLALAQERDIHPPPSTGIREGSDRNHSRSHSNSNSSRPSVDYNRPSVDYDIVVPWVLRNLLKSAAECGSYAGGLSGPSMLQDLLEAADTNNKNKSGSVSGVLVVPELRVVLSELGIRVTADVLREICRRYPAEMSDIQGKWKWILQQQKEQQRRAAEEMLRGSKDDDGDDDQAKGEAKYSSTSSDAKAGAKSSSSSATKEGATGSGSPDRKGSRSSDADDRTDEKSSSNRHSARKKRSAVQPDYAALVIEEADENLGVNVRHLLSDIISGRSLQSMTLSKSTAASALNSSYSSSNRPVTTLTDDLKELLEDGEHDELFRGSRNKFESSSRRSRVEDAVLGMKQPQSSSSLSQSKNESSVVLPSCVTISTILKARKNVINLTDSFGRTALILASALGQGELLTTLLEHGADVAAITPEGYNAFTVAKNPKMQGLAERRLLSWLNKRHHVSEKYNNKLQGGEGWLGSAAGSGGGADLRTKLLRHSEKEREREERKHIDGGDGDAKKERREEGGEGKIIDGDDDLISSVDNLRAEQSLLQGALRGDYHHSIQRPSLLSTSMLFTEDRSKAVTSLSTELTKLQDKHWSYSRPPLTWAVHNGLESSVKDMLKSGHNPNEPDLVGRTPLHECVDLIKSNQIVHVEAAVEIAEALVAAGAQVNAQTISGRTPLHEVFCKSQDESVSQCRISAGDQSMLYSTAGTKSTHDAHQVSRCRRLLVRALLHLGADPLILDRHGMAPIHYCARENLTSCLVEMLRIGANGCSPTSHQQTALHIACRAGATSIAHLLCRWDSDSPMGKGILDKKDKFGKTPGQVLSPSMSPRALDTLWGASRAGNISRVSEILRKLKMSKQALWEEVDRSFAGTRNEALSLGLTSSYDRSPFFPETSASASGSAGHVQKKKAGGVGGEELWLVDGVDAKTRRLRWTALHACVVGWAENQALTPSKDSSSRKNSNIISSSSGNKKSLSLNLSARRALGLSAAVTNQTSSSSSSSSVSFGSCQGTDTPASKERRSAVVTQKLSQPAQYRDTLVLLLQNHAFVDSLDVNCRTPLMLAAICNLPEACAILLDSDADAGATDLNGNTALHLAYAFGGMSSALVIEEKGADSDATNTSGRTASDEAGRYIHFRKIFDYPKKDRDNSISMESSDT